MTEPEAKIILQNAQADRLRYAENDDEAAFAFDAAAHADGVGAERRSFCRDSATKFANRAIKSRRLAEALTVAIARLPEGVSEPAPLPDEEAPTSLAQEPA